MSVGPSRQEHQLRGPPGDGTVTEPRFTLSSLGVWLSEVLTVFGVVIGWFLKYTQDSLILEK